MRCEDVARGVVVLELLDGDVEDAPLVSVELLGDMLLGELLLGELLLGDMLLGALLGDVVLDASGDVVVLGVVVVLPPVVLDPLLGAGVVRLTSPPEEFVTAPLGDAALLGAQGAVVVELEVIPLVEADMPLEVVLEVDVPRAAARAAAESAAVTGGVVPVPLAPFVLFSPVKR